MKRILLLLFDLISLSASVSAYDFMVDGLCYNVNSNGDEVSVTSAPDSIKENLSGEIVIPPRVLYKGKSYEVTKIGRDAFEGCSHLTAVTIPEPVTKVDEDAFAFCVNLATVNLPNSLISIEAGAFYSCESLTAIRIPATVTTIEGNAFKDCISLAKIDVDIANQTYDSRDSCNAIIETATNSLIVGCMNTHIPSSVRKIDWEAFGGCTGLTALVLPDSLTEIGSDAFFGCTGLTSVSIPDSVIKIGTSAFSGCEGLTSIVLPCSVKEIGGDAFGNCTGLTSMVIPDAVTAIGWSTFKGCSGLRSITIPKSVKQIGKSAFEGCSDLEDVHISDMAAWCKIRFDDNPLSRGANLYLNGEKVVSLEIPDAVTDISASAFKGYSGLISVTLPVSVRSVGKKAFAGCSNLTKIESRIQEPEFVSTDVTAFQDVDKVTCRVHVPVGTLKTYQSQTPWYYFANITEDFAAGNREVQSSGEDTESLKQQFMQSYDASHYDVAVTVADKLLGDLRFVSDSVNITLYKKFGWCNYINKDYQKAKECYEKYEKYFIQRNNNDHTEEAASVLERLGDCDLGMGNYAEAERNYLRAYDIYSDTTKSTIPQISKYRDYKHGYMARILLNLSECYAAQGKFSEAISAYKRSLLIKQELPEHERIMFNFTINVYDNKLINNVLKRGEELAEKGEYDDIIQYYEDAISFFEIKKSERCVEVALLLEKKGKYSFMRGYYDLALESFNRSSGICEQMTGYTVSDFKAANNAARYLGISPFRGIIFSNNSIYRLFEELSLDYGCYYASQGDFVQSYSYLRYYLDELSIESYNFLANSISSERTKYWQRHSPVFFETYPALVMMASEDVVNQPLIKDVHYGDLYGDLYNKSALFAKGLLLSCDNEFVRIIHESGNPALITRFDELKKLGDRLKLLYNNKSGDNKHSKNDIESLASDIETKANELEKELLAVSKDYGSYMAGLKLTWQDVQRNLGDNDMAVEFLSFKPLANEDTTTQYIALTVRNKDGYDEPHLVSLFNSAELDAVKDKAYTEKDLSRLLWGRLAEELTGAKNIYFSPSGELYNIAIESIPHWKQDCMMSDTFNLYRLSSTRQLAMAHPERGNGGAMVYGGIKYDTAVSTMKEIAQREKEKMPAHEDGINYYAMNSRDNSVMRNLQMERGASDSRIIEPLPGTLAESQNVTSMLKKKLKKPNLVTLLTGSDASEESFKNLKGQKRGVIHVATHGFYLSKRNAEVENEKLPMGFLLMGDNQQGKMEDESLSRTGLLFSGAQHIFNNVTISNDIDDGVLTANEVASLDLRGLDLLVMSACETARGDVTGEGVMGLQRGFKKAGAQSIVMSLWKVNDQATADMMREFYTYLKPDLSNKREAFLKAQQYIKAHDDYYRYSDNNDQEDALLRITRPHWAAFILLDALQ